MVKSTLVPGKILSFLFGVLFGIILLVGGIVGVGFYAYKKIPASKVLSLIPVEAEWLSADYAQKTAEELVKEFSSLKGDGLTLAKLAEISPELDKKLNEALDKVGETGIVSIDKEVLYETPVTSLTSSLSDVLIISASLNSMSEKLGFSLPDMPLIKGGEEGNEVWIYTAVNDNEDKKIEKAIELGEYTYHTVNYDYIQATVESDPSYTYTLAGVDSSGEYLKKEDNFIYIGTQIGVDENNEPDYVYDKIKSDNTKIYENGVFKTNELYLRSETPEEVYNKINDLQESEPIITYEIPLKYSYCHLYAEVEGEYVQATEYIDSSYNVLDEYKDVPLYAQKENYTEVSEDSLTDEFIKNNVLYVKSNGIGDLPITVGISALSKALDVNALSLTQVSEYFGVTLKNEMLDDIMDVPMANLSDSMNSVIDNLKLADVIDIKKGDSAILIYIAYGVEGVDFDYEGDTIAPKDGHEPRTISEVTECIDTLRIGNIIPATENSHRLIQAIQDWTLADFENSDKIDQLKLSDIMDVGDSTIMQAIKDCSIGDLPTTISSLTIEDMMGDVDEKDTILFAIKDCTIDTLPTAISELSLQDLFAEQVYAHHTLTIEELELLENNGINIPYHVWETGDHVPYDSAEHGEKSVLVEEESLFMDYTIAYDGTGTLTGLTDNYTNVAYKNVPLFAYDKEELAYVSATEITGYALPDGYSEDESYYYLDTDNTYKPAEDPVYDSHLEKNLYKYSVLHYLDENEEVETVELIPERLGIKDGYENTVLFAKMFIAEPDTSHEYGFANLYYYDIEAQAYKRVAAEYNKETGKFTIDDTNLQGETLYTHGNPKGIWKYLLMKPYDEDSKDGGYETIGSINNIGEQVSHACSNINKATINDLYADGLITIDGDTTELEKPIDHDHNANTDKIALGDMTIGEMLTYIIGLPG